MGVWHSNDEDQSLFNRRIGPDWIQKAMLWLAISCWVLFLAALILFHYAKPEDAYGYLRYLDIEVRDYWLPDMKTLLELILWTCNGLTLLTIIVNHFRSRRVQDRRWYNLILLLLVSAGAIFTLIRPF